MKRNYRRYSKEITVVKKFEEYEESLNIDFGTVWEDFSDWFLCFRAGFEAGGNS